MLVGQGAISKDFAESFKGLSRNVPSFAANIFLKKISKGLDLIFTNNKSKG